MKTSSVVAAMLLCAGAHLEAQTQPQPGSGQAAFATIAGVVKTLKEDPSTDWSKVDIEALRQHLIDMDDVMLRANVVAKNIPGGVELTVTGSGHTGDAIKRMLTSHVASLDEVPDLTSSVKTIANGVVTTVVAAKPSDAATVARIRGLGFAGLLVEGDHHARHHLMLARGEAMGHR